MRRYIPMALVAGLLVGMAPAAAHETDLITPGGRVGPVRTQSSTFADMKDVFGSPTSRKVVTVGCSRVIRLRWRGQIEGMAYRADDDRVVVDIKVFDRSVRAPGLNRTYSFHTRKGLRVGDSEARLKELYPLRSREGHTHRGHTHYLLGESDRGTRLLAKVIDGKVVQLETAPYEFC